LCLNYAQRITPTKTEQRLSKDCTNIGQRVFDMAKSQSDSPEKTVSGVQPAVILIEPQMGENIGAAARAMLNFGLERMRITAPRDGWPNQKAVATASGAGRVLDEALLYDTTADALADLTFVFATTARVRDIIKPIFTPEQAIGKARDLSQKGERVGIMFGPERAGLTNDDAAQAQAFISIPVNPEFSSLNLAQSVLLMAYEWRRLGENPVAVDEAEFCSRVDIDQLTTSYTAELEKKGFFWPQDKAEHMKLHLASLFARLPLNDADVRIFHGIRRALLRTRPPKN
jgi:tRNA/rRNA methyltransferase